VVNSVPIMTLTEAGNRRVPQKGVSPSRGASEDKTWEQVNAESKAEQAQRSSAAGKNADNSALKKKAAHSDGKDAQTTAGENPDKGEKGIASGSKKKTQQAIESKVAEQGRQVKGKNQAGNGPGQIPGRADINNADRVSGNVQDSGQSSKAGVVTNGQVLSGQGEAGRRGVWHNGEKVASEPGNNQGAAHRNAAQVGNSSSKGEGEKTATGEDGKPTIQGRAGKGRGQPFRGDVNSDAHVKGSSRPGHRYSEGNTNNKALNTSPMGRNARQQQKDSSTKGDVSKNSDKQAAVKGEQVRGQKSSYAQNIWTFVEKHSGKNAVNIQPGKGSLDAEQGKTKERTGRLQAVSGQALRGTNGRMSKGEQQGDNVGQQAANAGERHSPGVMQLRHTLGVDKNGMVNNFVQGKSGGDSQGNPFLRNEHNNVNKTSFAKTFDGQPNTASTRGTGTNFQIVRWSFQQSNGMSDAFGKYGQHPWAKANSATMQAIRQQANSQKQLLRNQLRQTLQGGKSFSRLDRSRTAGDRQAASRKLGSFARQTSEPKGNADGKNQNVKDAVAENWRNAAVQAKSSSATQSPETTSQHAQRMYQQMRSDLYKGLNQYRSQSSSHFSVTISNTVLGDGELSFKGEQGKLSVMVNMSNKNIESQMDSLRREMETELRKLGFSSVELNFGANSQDHQQNDENQNQHDNTNPENVRLPFDSADDGDHVLQSKQA